MNNKLVDPSTLIRPSQPVIPQWYEWISKRLHLSFSYQWQVFQVEDMLPCIHSKNLDEASSVSQPKAYWGKPTIPCTYIPEPLDPLDIRGTAAVHWGTPTKLPLSVYNSHATTAREIVKLGSLTVQLTPMGWQCANTWFSGITTLKMRKRFRTRQKCFLYYILTSWKEEDTN